MKKRIPIIFGSWSLYVIIICLITSKMWDYYGYGLWQNRDAEISMVYTILSGSVSWYLNALTLELTILVSFILSLVAIFIMVRKFLGEHNNISYKVLIIWFILNSINVPLWLWLLGMQ